MYWRRWILNLKIIPSKDRDKRWKANMLTKNWYFYHQKMDSFYLKFSYLINFYFYFWIRELSRVLKLHTRVVEIAAAEYCWRKKMNELVRTIMRGREREFNTFYGALLNWSVPSSSFFLHLPFIRYLLLRISIAFHREKGFLFAVFITFLHTCVRSFLVKYITYQINNLLLQS